MAELGDDVVWPPQPIATGRLTLRSTCAADRAGYIDMLCSSEVRRYLGGPMERDRVEADAPEVPGARPGVFAVADTSGFVGTVSLTRRDDDQPGHLRPGGGELEVGYTLLPEFWGRGYGFEAVSAVLAWAAARLPDDEVILCTQVANNRSRRLAERLGFTEAGRFRAWDADQWLGVRSLRSLPV